MKALTGLRGGLGSLLARAPGRAGGKAGGRSAIDAPASSAICIPVEGRKDAAFVAGVSWTPHLTQDSVTAEAVAKGKRAGFTHSYIRSKTAAESYGLAKVDGRDARAFRHLLPLSVAFARSVQDKAATSVFVLDLRDPKSAKGTIYVAAATRGHPLGELLAEDRGEALRQVSAWSGQSGGGVTVYVDDTGIDGLFDEVAHLYPSASELRLAKIASSGIQPMAALDRREFKRVHGVLLGIGLLALLGWEPATKAYHEHIATIDAAEAQRQAARRFINARDSGYAAGYVANLDVALKESLRDVLSMPLMRNGWGFVSADCSMADKACVRTWSRVYGTYDTFLESAIRGCDVTLDASNFRIIRERCPIQLPSPDRPVLDRLPSETEFVKTNGDRADTLLLAGFKDYTVEVFKPLAVWDGKGVPPGPRILAAGWKLTAMPDQVVEAVANARLTREFSATRMSLSMDNAQQFQLTVEGTAYVRQ